MKPSLITLCRTARGHDIAGCVYTDIAKETTSEHNRLRAIEEFTAGGKAWEKLESILMALQAHYEELP